MVFGCNLFQLVGQQTHISGNTLDLVQTAVEQAVIEPLKVHPASDCPMGTDHFMISFALQGKASLLQHSPCATSAVVFDNSKADWEGLCNYLLDQDFGTCYNDEGVELIWCAIRQIVPMAMNIYIPKVRLRRHQLPKWFSPDLRHRYTKEEMRAITYAAHNLAKRTTSRTSIQKLS